MPCSHVDDLTPVPPRTPEGCEECLKLGAPWVHLRLCLSCGHVGCCDSSPGGMPRSIFTTAHPVMASFERGERWAWCFVDRQDPPLPAAAEPYLRD